MVDAPIYPLDGFLAVETHALLRLKSDHLHCGMKLCRGPFGLELRTAVIICEYGDISASELARLKHRPEFRRAARPVEISLIGYRRVPWLKPENLTDLAPKIPADHRS